MNAVKQPRLAGEVPVAVKQPRLAGGREVPVGMKITIEPTEHFFMAGDVMVRMWTGNRVETGEPVIAMVSCVGLADGDVAALARGLVSIPPPGAEAQQRWAELIVKPSADEARSKRR